ncbi:MAG: nucleotidyltransferase [Bacteroidetes bacterium RIFCSPHIGHO2_02_FULL_44_7]|nr:MAG: nucleotidyltransferase [Bacteroidetes bacterium RIFCSPHIGHO2_02_FULL_44_7]
MKIIVPMAGRGSRLRPHTLTVPKPLLSVAGQPIVHRLVKEIANVVNEPIEEVAFILGDPAFFGDDVVKSLTKLAEELNARASIYRQDEPLGTGHAIMCAKESLSGPAVIAYADTLIQADFDLDPRADSVIWVKQVERPEAYGVVQLNAQKEIVELVEKPQDFVSDLAVIGIYYFREVGDLKTELQHVLDNNIVNGGEYQINDGIKGMMAKGKIFKTGQVDQWMDCGNKQVTVETNAQVLDNEWAAGINNVDSSTVNENSVIIQPCYIGEGVVLKNSVVGPHVSIGAGSTITNSVIHNSILQEHTRISATVLGSSMIGSHVVYQGLARDLSMGDYSTIHE